VAWDLLFDDDGDLTDDGAGGYVTTETAASMVRHQEHDTLGAWAGDPTAGRRKDGSGLAGKLAMEREAQSYRECYAVLEHAGVIADVQVTIDKDGDNRFVVVSTMTDLLHLDVADVAVLEEFGEVA